MNSYWDLGIMPKKGELMVAISNYHELFLTQGREYKALTDTGDATSMDHIFVTDDRGCLKSCAIKYFTPYNPEGDLLDMENKLPIEQINEMVDKLPTMVLEDIHRRMMDWKATGGKDDDPYMYQQLRYARHVLHSIEGVKQ